MKWILLLTLITPSGTSIESVEVTSQRGCYNAGQAWVKETSKIKGPVTASFVCVPNE